MSHGETSQSRAGPCVHTVGWGGQPTQCHVATQAAGVGWGAVARAQPPHVGTWLLVHDSGHVDSRPDVVPRQEPLVVLLLPPPPPHALAVGTPGPCLPQPCSVCCGLQPGGSPAGGPGACAIIQGGGAGACTPQGGLVLDGDDAVWGGLQNRAAPWPVNVQAESALGQLWTFHLQPGTWPASGTF